MPPPDSVRLGSTPPCDHRCQHTLKSQSHACCLRTPPSSHPQPPAQAQAVPRTPPGSQALSTDAHSSPRHLRLVSDWIHSPAPGAGANRAQTLMLPHWPPRPRAFQSPQHTQGHTDATVHATVPGRRFFFSKPLSEHPSLSLPALGVQGMAGSPRKF